MYLVDTSIWIHALRPQGDPGIKERLRPLVASGHAATTAWILLELMTGIRSGESKEALLTFFAPLPRLAFEPSFWQDAWDLAISLRKKGLSPSAADCFIATVAMSHQVPLIHLNGDFVWMAQHSELKAINWSRLL